MTEETKVGGESKSESKGKGSRDPKQTDLAAAKPEPAKALMSLTMGEKDADGNVRRWTIEKGEMIPEDKLVGLDLEEGKHFRRGEPPKAGPVKIDGKDHRKAKIEIVGVKGDKNERYTFQPGELIPIDQLSGLREGVHFE